MSPVSSTLLDHAWLRRLVLIPIYLGLGLFASLATPIALALCLTLDLLSPRHFARSRCWLMLLAYLWAEIAGLGASAVLWIARHSLPAGSHARSQHWHYRLQALWAGTLLGVTRRLFSLDIEADDVAIDPTTGPFVVLMRHTSIADTLLPQTFLSSAFGLELRYVLKRELRLDPCLDVVGGRIPNRFVSRQRAQQQHDLVALAALARDLAPNQGVLIYPEGTRFTVAKRARRAAELARERDEARAAHAVALRHLLPIRMAGTEALLDACPRATVVVFGHVGLEGVTSLRHVWQGALVGRTIRLATWTIPATRIPRDRAARRLWLDQAWAALDSWVETWLTSARARSGAHEATPQLADTALKR